MNGRQTFLYAVEISCNAVNQLKCVRYVFFAADINCYIISSAFLCYLSMRWVIYHFFPMHIECSDFLHASLSSSSTDEVSTSLYDLCDY